jgi:hypothetical protein
MVYPDFEYFELKGPWEIKNNTFSLNVKLIKESKTDAKWKASHLK